MCAFVAKNSTSNHNGSLLHLPFTISERTILVKIKLHKFDNMQVQAEIDFNQLVQLAKQLPEGQWTRLKQEVEAQELLSKEREEFRNLLLSGPTFSQEQLDKIAETRKQIDEWRIK